MKHISKAAISEMEKIERLNLINSCTGYKSANLIATKSVEGITNVEIENGILKGILNEFNQSTKENDQSNFTLNLETLDFKETPIVEIKKWWKIF